MRVESNHPKFSLKNMHFIAEMKVPQGIDPNGVTYFVWKCKSLEFRAPPSDMFNPIRVGTNCNIPENELVVIK